MAARSCRGARPAPRSTGNRDRTGRPSKFRSVTAFVNSYRGSVRVRSSTALTSSAVIRSLGPHSRPAFRAAGKGPQVEPGQFQPAPERPRGRFFCRPPTSPTGPVPAVRPPGPVCPPCGFAGRHRAVDDHALGLHCLVYPLAAVDPVGCDDQVVALGKPFFHGRLQHFGPLGSGRHAKPFSRQ